MKLELNKEETKISEWALIHYTSYLEQQLKTIPEQDIWKLYERDLELTIKILEKIRNEKSNQRKN